jgi:membrane associated rhomboid family serine protease
MHDSMSFGRKQWGYCVWVMWFWCFVWNAYREDATAATYVFVLVAMISCLVCVQQEDVPGSTVFALLAGIGASFLPKATRAGASADMVGHILGFILVLVLVSWRFRVASRILAKRQLK